MFGNVSEEHKRFNVKDIQVFTEKSTVNISNKFMNDRGDHNIVVTEKTVITGDEEAYKEATKEAREEADKELDSKNIFGPKVPNIKDELTKLDIKSEKDFIRKITNYDRSKDVYTKDNFDIIKFEKEIRDLPRKSVNELIDTIVMDLSLTKIQGNYYIGEEPYIIGTVNNRDIQLDVNNIYDYAVEYYEEHAFYKLYEEYQLRLFMKDKNDRSEMHTRLKGKFGRRINYRNTRYGVFKPKHYLNLTDLLKTTYSFLIPKFVIERTTYGNAHATEMHTVTSGRDIEGVDSRSLVKVGVRRSLGNIIELASEGIDIKLRYRNQLMPLIADLEYSLGITGNLVIISDDEEYNKVVDFYDNISSIYADNLNEYNKHTEKTYKKFNNPVVKDENKYYGDSYETKEDIEEFPNDGNLINYNIDSIARNF